MIVRKLLARLRYINTTDAVIIAAVFAVTVFSASMLWKLGLATSGPAASIIGAAIVLGLTVAIVAPLHLVGRILGLQLLLSVLLAHYVTAGLRTLLPMQDFIVVTGLSLFLFASFLLVLCCRIFILRRVNLFVANSLAILAVVLLWQNGSTLIPSIRELLANLTSPEVGLLTLILSAILVLCGLWIISDASETFKKSRPYWEFFARDRLMVQSHSTWWSLIVTQAIVLARDKAVQSELLAIIVIYALIVRFIPLPFIAELVLALTVSLLAIGRVYHTELSWTQTVQKRYSHLPNLRRQLVGSAVLLNSLLLISVLGTICYIGSTVFAFSLMYPTLIAFVGLIALTQLHLSAKLFSQ